MKIYLAGVLGGNWIAREQEYLDFWERRLWSYHTIIFTNKKEIMRRTKNKINLFLDSGAFSAWSQGLEIDIQEYIKFIKEHEDVIEVYANLDEISRSKDKLGTPRSAEKTWENQKIMEEAGLNPLPVFHYGEPVEYLERYAKNYDYISLGGMVPVSNTQLRHWLDRQFHEILTDKDGYPITKVHGFGLTSLRLMLEYPWYSVDSTSWVITGRMGSVYVPQFKKGKWIYDQNAWKVAVSNRSPGKKDKDQHIDTYPPGVRKIMLDYIHDKGFQLGKSEFERVEEDRELADNERWAEKKDEATDGKRLMEIIVEPGISNKYQLRDEMNVIFFLDLEDSMPEYPWKFRPSSQTKTLF